MGKKMSNMENSFDDMSHLSPQNLGSSSPGKKQSKENTITVSGSLLVRWGGIRGRVDHSWGCCPGNVDSQPELFTRKWRSSSQSLGSAEVAPIPSFCQFLLVLALPWGRGGGQEAVTTGEKPLLRGGQEKVLVGEQVEGGGVCCVKRCDMEITATTGLLLCRETSGRCQS